MPKTRPVCLCSSSMNGRPSEILSDILVPVGRERGKYVESESTEESLYNLEKANETVREWKEKGEGIDLVIGSMDVEALYPSLQIERTAVAMGQMMEETSVEYKNIDFDTATRFIASNASEADIWKWGMGKYIPRRRHKQGSRPGPTTAELGVKRKYDSLGEEIVGESKWVVKRKILTEKEKRKVLGKIVEIGTRLVFRNHVYQWGGRFYIQKEGGSIGLRLTGVAAKLTLSYTGGGPKCPKVFFYKKKTYL